MAITRYGLAEKKVPASTLIPSTGPTPMRFTTEFDPDNPDTSATGGTSSTGTGGLSTIVLDTSGGSGGLYSYKSALEKIKADQEAAAAAAERARTGALLQGGYLQNQLLTAGKINPTLLTTLEEQKTAQEKYINDQLAALQGQLTKSYETGSGLQTQAYDALRNYLTANAPTAYAQAPRATAPAVSSDIAQYMASRGVEAQRAEPGLLAARAALEGGATNYNNLLNTLAAQSAAGQESRLAEQQMAQQLAAAQLGAYKAQQEGTLTSQQLAALQDIQSQYNTAKFQAQQQAIARQQALQDALGTLLGTGYLSPSSPDQAVQDILGTAIPAYAEANKVNTPPPTPIEQLLNVPIKASNTALINRLANFAATNPNATAAQIQKAFPALGKNVR